MTEQNSSPTTLGAFSLSLAVQDLARSQAFYEKLGFTTAGGDVSQNWLILRNGSVTLGLFQGMFERNMLTFNPGWDGEAKPVADFEDVRGLQRRLTEAGLEFASRVEDEEGSGPASFVVVDPDGNPILVDQHV